MRPSLEQLQTIVQQHRSWISTTIFQLSKEEKRELVLGQLSGHCRDMYQLMASLPNGQSAMQAQAPALMAPGAAPRASIAPTTTAWPNRLAMNNTIPVVVYPNNSNDLNYPPRKPQDAEESSMTPPVVLAPAALTRGATSDGEKEEEGEEELSVELVPVKLEPGLHDEQEKQEEDQDHWRGRLQALRYRSGRTADEKQSVAAAKNSRRTTTTEIVARATKRKKGGDDKAATTTKKPAAKRAKRGGAHETSL